MIRRFRLVLLAVAAIGLGVVLGWLALRGQDWAEVGRYLSNASVPRLVLAFLLVFVSFVVRAYRWLLLFSRGRVSARRLYLVETAASGVNNISPVRWANEPVQFGLLVLRDRLGKQEVIVSLALQKIVDLVSTLILVAVGLFAFSTLDVLGGYVLLAAIVIALVVVVPLTLLALAQRYPLLRRMPFMDFLFQTKDLIIAARGKALLSTLVAVAFWLSIGGIGFIVADAMGIGLPFFPMVMITLLMITFSAFVPGLPGGFGNFELAAVFLLGLWDIPREQALAFGFLLHLVLHLPPTLVAIVVLPLENVRWLNAMLGLAGRRRRKRLSDASETSDRRKRP